LLVESDSSGVKNGSFSQEQILEKSCNRSVLNLPKVFILATSELEKKIFPGLSENAFIMKPLKGSTVAACLQLALGVDLQNCNRDGNNVDGLSLHGLLDGKNILVVDDNKVNLRVAAGTLKKYGAKVVCVESGKDALALLQVPHKFDACFMDVQMPEMDGYVKSSIVFIFLSCLSSCVSSSGNLSKFYCANPDLKPLGKYGLWRRRQMKRLKQGNMVQKKLK
jgi:arabidopsis histidine kinase 2/3/4 (cytokinin receptor)